MLKRVFISLVVVAALTAFPWSRVVADIATTQVKGTLSSPSPLLTARCRGGQSSFVVQALATTIPGPTPTPSPTPPATPTPGPTSTPITASFSATVWTAADVGEAPGPTESPIAVTPGPTFSSAPAKVYGKLTSDQWVFVLASFTQGALPVTITCSAAQY